MILAFLKNCLLKKPKKTHKTLIPKEENLDKVNDYRPINLCNDFYKFISILLANELHTTLSKLILYLESALF